MWYNLTREEAAKILGISTRTLDRRVRKWILSYEKKWNKVYLSEEEVKEKSHNNYQEIPVVMESNTRVEEHYVPNLSLDTSEIVDKLWKHLDENFSKFLVFLAEKDKQLEEKNKVIFTLHERLGELENKLKNTVALPMYEKEKHEIIIEKEKLKLDNEKLRENLKKEKIINIFIVGILVLLIIAFIFIFMNKDWL